MQFVSGMENNVLNAAKYSTMDHLKDGVVWHVINVPYRWYNTDRVTVQFLLDWSNFNIKVAGK